jgi:hypothetical protein
MQIVFKTLTDAEILANFVPIFIEHMNTSLHEVWNVDCVSVFYSIEN